MTAVRSTSAAAVPTIVWFRDDLRLADHPALAAAGADPVLCVYVLDEASPGVRALGGAAAWWRRHSLAALAAAIKRIGGRLDIIGGRADEAIPALAADLGAVRVLALRRFGAAETAIDARAAAELSKRGATLRLFDGFLLHDPQNFSTQSGKPYRVFTPFWRTLRERTSPPAPTPAPRRLAAFPWPAGGPARLAGFASAPDANAAFDGLGEFWRPGEQGARESFAAFLETGLARYAERRDFPAQNGVSRLSPHIRFGELSVGQIWRATLDAAWRTPGAAPSAEKFLSEIAWREFSYHLLWQYPDLARRNFNQASHSFRWDEPNELALAAWRAGRTGYPIVDAGMRELLRTGFMHNRARLIAASFLVKDLLQDWRLGEQWFWERLCDADPANNPANWQWCAGTGADAAPYFRIFNPIAQGKKFDPDGDYMRRHTPELADVPADALHAPRGPSLFAPDYPAQIVDHALARERALARYRERGSRAPRDSDSPRI